MGASPHQAQRTVNQLADLLEKIFVLDPTQRITVSDALKHPFVFGDAFQEV